MSGLTGEQEQYVARIRAVATDHLLAVPAVHGAVNRPLVKALGDHGLLRGLFGGTPDEPPRDAAALQLCLLRETLATVTTEAETALALQGLGSYPILQSGSPEVIERWIPGVVAGTTVPAFALSEPGAGSDAAALSLRAEPGRRRLAAARREDLDLQRPRRRRLLGVRAHHRRRGRPRGHRVRGGRRRRGAVGRAPRHGGAARDRPAGLRRGPGRSRRRARRGRQRVRGGDAHPRPVPAQRGRVRGRDGAGRARRRTGLVADPRGPRRPADPAAVGRAHAGRDGHPHRGRAAARPVRRDDVRPWGAGRRDHAHRRDGQAVRDRERPVGGRPGGAAARRARSPAGPSARAALS